MVAVALTRLQAGFCGAMAAATGSRSGRSAPSSVVDRAQSRLVRQQRAHGDALLSVGGELRPVVATGSAYSSSPREWRARRRAQTRPSWSRTGDEGVPLPRPPGRGLAVPPHRSTTTWFSTTTATAAPTSPRPRKFSANASLTASYPGATSPWTTTITTSAPSSPASLSTKRAPRTSSLNPPTRTSSFRLQQCVSQRLESRAPIAEHNPDYLILRLLETTDLLEPNSRKIQGVRERERSARERPPNRPAAPLAACVTGLTLLAFSTDTPLSTAARRRFSSRTRRSQLHLTLDRVLARGSEARSATRGRGRPHRRAAARQDDASIRAGPKGMTALDDERASRATVPLLGNAARRRNRGPA